MKSISGPLVHVLILSHNGARWLDTCLGSLDQTQYENLAVTVVDNGSTDASPEHVERAFSKVSVLRTGRNLSFAAGNNHGIRVALAQGADYVVLLNNDTRVEPPWLAEIVRAGERDPGVGILGPIQLGYQDDELNEWSLTALRPWLHCLRSEPTPRPFDVEWVEGSCFVVKRRVLEQVGLLDTVYPAFYEEIDYCRRARRSGWRTMLVPSSRVHHYRGGSWTRDKATEQIRSRVLDLSQFIYTVTDPARSTTQIGYWYLVTLGTKLKAAVGSRSLAMIGNLIRVQLGLLVLGPRLLSKWRRDRIVGHA